jgi:hypothetical protein
MTSKAIDPARLGELAAAANLTVKDANKAKISELLAAIRNGVMRRADGLPIDTPPALLFDPR